MNSSATHLDASKRHNFILLFDVMDGNPNGDPEDGGRPRQDPVTLQGIVTDGAIKRKVRNYVDITHGNEARFKIYVQDKGIPLNSMHRRAYVALGLTSTGSKQAPADVEKTREWMCHNFYDVRTFGGVMTTGVNCGQVLGPVQISLARSLDPVDFLDLTITRVAVTDAGDSPVDAEGSVGKKTEMGSRTVIPYGLYRAFGSVSPTVAAKTSFDTDDLALLWEALEHTWDLDRSAMRGRLAFRGLVIFTHSNPLGNAPEWRLHEQVQIAPITPTPRQFGDYTLQISDSELPAGVTITRIGI